ncbi:TolC family protein [Synechococcus sp. CCY9201]|uniref:TolC family protein n=1 Tax=Synechococcus sp. CCY9201 TaxID=174697 RepID=UPI002B2076F9|nr:TolC family protein [Synechococcus sp. CCY9201]MEA5475968.1 TolC family protein [Synechococcus sp. CCY9201]
MALQFSCIGRDQCRSVLIGLLLSCSFLAQATALGQDLSSVDPALADPQGISQVLSQGDPTPLVQLLDDLEAELQANARPLKLEEAVSLGIANNPKLLDAFSSIQQYEWQLIAAQRRWYPSLQLANGTPFAGYSWSTFVQNNYGFSRAASRQTGQGEGVLSEKSRLAVFQPGVILSWNFIDPTRQPDINSASDSLRQQKLLFDASARNLVLSIQQSYYSTQSDQQLIDSFKKIYAINKQQLATLTAQKSIGMVTVLDLEQTRSQLFAQLSQLITYTRDFIDQTALLAEALGLPPGALAIPSDAARMQGQWTLPLRETIARATEQREEIQASLAAAEAARWSAVAAIRSYLPVFQIVGAGNLYAINGLDGIPSNADPGDRYSRSRTWDGAAGLGFSWSIFDGGIQAANAEAAYAQERQQKAVAASTQLQVVREVRSSYGQLITSKIAVESAQQAYRSAELAQEAARARFEVGVGDITSVVQTIQQLSDAAEQVAQAVLAYNIAIAELYRYSATWPAQTESAVQNRIRTMRHPTASTPASETSSP